MIRTALRRFRQLPNSLSGEAAINASGNKAAQLTWIEKLKEIEDFAKAGGSEKAHKLHKSRNKFFVEERINAIKDPGTEILEIGLLAGYDLDYGSIPRATLLTCIAWIHGIPTIIGGSDATVKGGTSYPITVAKSNRVSDVARQNFLPTISLVDSGGAFLPLQSEIFPDKNHGGRNFYNIATISSMGIPKIGVVCGSCTAGGAYTPSMCDEMVFVDKMGTMFLGGPPLVEAATGEIVTGEELGGAMLHCSVSGGADYFAKDENESAAYVRSIFETLNIPAFPTSRKASVNPNVEYDILDVASTNADARLTIACLTDGSAFHEFKELFGTGLVCGYGRVNGHMTGFVANNGDLDSDASLKGAHFVHLANERKIPIVFLQNSTFHENFDQENETVEKSADTIRARAAYISAVTTSKSPKVTICCAGPNRLSDLCPRQYDPNFLFRWPASTALRSGNDWEDESIFSSARLWDDGTIDPRTSRDVLTKCLDIFEFSRHHEMHIRSKELDSYQPMYRL